MLLLGFLDCFPKRCLINPWIMGCSSLYEGLRIGSKEFFSEFIIEQGATQVIAEVEILLFQ
jgi:hypothetical protein